jgi:hypothetical protein
MTMKRCPTCAQPMPDVARLGGRRFVLIDGQWLCEVPGPDLQSDPTWEPVPERTADFISKFREPT